MTISSDDLTREILAFMTVIHECYSNTDYANDRSIYAEDLMAAMQWIVDLQAGESPEGVVARIKSCETEKQFGDYWRQGEWGDKEAISLKKLKGSL